jgi:hypothetical protein
MVYDQKTKQRGRKASCAAIIVEVIRKGTGDQSLVELYSETFKRSGGNEFQLRDALQKTVSNALKILEVNPMSAIVWRDGIGESSFDRAAQEEIAGIRQGLMNHQGRSLGGELHPGRPQPVQLAYIVCQKRIDVSIITRTPCSRSPFSCILSKRRTSLTFALVSSLDQIPHTGRKAWCSVGNSRKGNTRSPV